jgi:hypothetical protein
LAGLVILAKVLEENNQSTNTTSWGFLLYIISGSRNEQNPWVTNTNQHSMDTEGIFFILYVQHSPSLDVTTSSMWAYCSSRPWNWSSKVHAKVNFDNTMLTQKKLDDS